LTLDKNSFAIFVISRQTRLSLYFLLAICYVHSLNVFVFNTCRFELFVSK